MKTELALFEGYQIRRHYDEQTETWWFSVVDIIRVLTQQPDSKAAQNYWKVLKHRLNKEGSQVVTNCNHLKMPAADGKSYLTDAATSETLLRLVQSVPSPKAEPIKLWLAKTGYERMQEIADPARALARARETWQKQGHSGTRLFEGKDYFTIYDFVKAHLHFSDPEWDGEPLEPEPTAPCPRCGQAPCVCVVAPPKPCAVCGQTPCICEKEPGPKQKRVKVKLADGKARNIQHMMSTTFWHPDGTPMSAQQFMEMLFGKLPEFFANEAELRAIWSAPDTRAKLLHGLADKGFGKEQLAEMQKIIDAENSDLFDVLAHVAYAVPPVTREVRAANARVYINTQFSAKQQTFLDFVLQHYVTVGVEELDQDKLTPLLRLKYHDSIADAVADLGKPDEIGKVFAGFQRYLYQ